MSFWNRASLGHAALGSTIFIVLVAALLWPTAALVSLLGIWSLWEARVLFLPVLLASVLTTLLYDRMPLAWAGLAVDRWTPRLVGAGLALGAGAAVAASIPTVLASGSAATTTASIGTVLIFVLFLLVGAVTEELIFRGYLFARIAQVAGPTGAAVISSMTFAAAHAWNPSVTPLALANILVAGVLFSAARLRSGEVWLPSALHGAWNVAVAVGLGLPLSGIDFGVSLWRFESGGPEVLTGGVFGPEGGVAATAALIAALVLLHRWRATEMSPYLHARVFRSVYRRQADDAATSVNPPSPG